MQTVTDRVAVDLRLYRIAWLPVLLAVVVLMFSLEGAPEPIEPVAPPGTFEPDRAARQAREIVSAAPAREPGSDGDAAIAGLVANRLEDIRAGATTEQRFDGSFDGDDVELTNVLLTLPGDSERTIVVLAPRDAATGPGAASSAAATGILIELANVLGVAGHEKTIVFASTSGGAQGAEELLANLPESDTVEAVIAIYQPGAVERRPPFVLTGSTGETSAPVQLERTAELAVETQAQETSSHPSGLAQLAHLAIPSGLGPQAPLIAAGFDAVAISSAGERPLPATEDGLEDLSQEAIDAFGRAAQLTIGAVDVSLTELEHGPGTHLELGDNLVPGWTLALLALTLLLPTAVAAVDGCARGARHRQRLGGGLAWAAARALPLLGALAIVYLLAIFGAVPSPPFPFDPGLYEAGGRAVVAFTLALIAAAASALLLRRLGVTARRSPDSALPALGAVAVIAALIVWLANPYLALLVAAAAHVWLIAVGAPSATRRAGVLVGAALSCLPLVLALVAISSDLELGATAPWTFTLMLADGQIGFVVAVAGCFLGGALLGTAALALRRPEPVPADA
jgi:hypothetical protein